MKNKTSWGLGVLFWVFGCGAWAQQSSTQPNPLRGPWAGSWGSVAPYVGFDAGYTAYSAELDVEGVPAQAKIIGSYLAPNLAHVFDFGVGFGSQSFSQEAAVDRVVQSTVFEAAYRYQWPTGLQAGVVWNTLFDKGASYGANQGDVQFAGVQLLKEFPLSQDWMMRAGGRYMTDVNVNSTWLNVVMVDLEFGWSPHRARDIAAVSYVAPPEVGRTDRQLSTNPDNMDVNALPGVDRPITDADEVPMDRPVVEMPPSHPSEDFTAPPMREARPEDYVASRDFLLFDRNSASLGSQNRSKLERLAAALKDNESLVGQVEVVGQADPAAARPARDLSQKRVDNVKSALESQGLKVVARTEPLPPPEMAKKDGRVELRFHDVKDKKKLDKIVKSIE